MSGMYAGHGAFITMAGAFILSVNPAYAAYELPTHLKPDLFCAAKVSLVAPAHQLNVNAGERDLGTDNEFGVLLEADTPKEVSGTLDILSGTSVYSAAVMPQSLTEARREFSIHGKSAYSATVYRSKPIYFQLPATVAVSAVWLSSATVNGAPADCATLPFVKRTGPFVEGLQPTRSIGSAEELRAAAPLRGEPVTLVKHLDMSDCSTVFKEGRMIRGAAPSYPASAQGATGNAVILLAIDSVGHVADAAVFGSSGSEALDAAGLLAASQSFFAPPEFLCAPIPGFYNFVARFGS